MCERPSKCEKKADPDQCSPEQIRKCHGDTALHECEAEGCSGAPDPAECSPEQVRKCHGTASEHPCVEKP